MCRSIESRFSARQICGFFLIALFVIGILTAGQYGYYFDEGGEREIVASNIKEYVLRLFPEGNAIREFYLEVDRKLSEAGGKSIERISESVEKDHGAAVMYPMMPVMLTGIPTHVQSLIWHGYVFCVFFTSVPAIFYIGKALFDSPFSGLLFALVYFFTPRIFAEAHYNNKDILLLALTVDLMALLLRMIGKYRTSGKIGKVKFLLAALCAGFLMNTKIVGIAIVCLFGLMFIAMLCVLRAPAKKIAGISCLLLLLSLLFYFLFTPAMWGGINEIISFHTYLIENANDFSRWDQPILFNGSIYMHSTNPLPAAYLYTMILLTTPVYVLVFFVFGLGSVIVRLFKEKAVFFGKVENCALPTALLLFFVPTLYATICNTHIYNGWRHFYFVYAGMVILSAYGICRLGQLLKERPQKFYRKIYYALIFALVGVSAAGIAVNHPYQYAYFNILAPRAEEKYELDYWNLSIKSAVDFIIDDTAGNSQAPTVGGSDRITQTGLLSTVMFAEYGDKVELVLPDVEADYIVENLTYSSAYGQEYFDISDYTAVKTIYSYGNKICTVYKHN